MRSTAMQGNGYSIVVDIGGHGVGLEFHEDPFVSYVTPKGTEMLMVPGMVFTIEPMVNAGTAEIIRTPIMAGRFIQMTASRPHSGRLPLR